MNTTNASSVTVVIPNWNGEDYLKKCLDSLLAQTLRPRVVVVENDSSDNSIDILDTFTDVVVLRQSKNLGFAEGVNVGIRHALENQADYILLLNNDAEADKTWVEQLVSAADMNKQIGIVCPKLLSIDGKSIDSTGDFYTIYGLPFPRGRGEKETGQYDEPQEVFGASGGASLYRASMLREIGLFDAEFFAYFEDVDISFRAQLAGWKVFYQPKAVVYHHISATSAKLGDFRVYQTAKNFPFLFVKNMPGVLFWKYLPLVFYWYARMFGARIVRGGRVAFARGMIASLLKLPKKLLQRHKIQKKRTVSTAYIDSILYHDRAPILRKETDENSN